MTDRELMQQALRVLDQVAGAMPFPVALQVLAALRERLAQPQRTHWEGCEAVHPECKKPRREWVGLTRAERFEIEKAMSQYYDYRHECKTVCLPEFAAAIEAKLKEKNT